MNGGNINRRQWLKLAGLAATGLTAMPWIPKVAFAVDAATQPTNKFLFFTKSVGYEHDMVKRPKATQRLWDTPKKKW